MRSGVAEESVVIPPGRRRGRGDAVAAVCAQLSQAAASFLLQVLAARELGAKGLGTFALLYGFIVLGTAISTGLVGDSLTVLDRRTPRVRAGLAHWAVGAATLGAFVATSATYVAGYLPLGAACLGGLACAVFMLEDVLRRALMACGRFWALVGVDASSLVVSVGVVLVWRAIEPVTITTFVVALLAGQVIAGGVALVVLPPDERGGLVARQPARREVWDYGVWRALQQGLRPAMMAGVRVLVTAVVGLAAFGALDAARVYVAPAMLVVSGVGSYLFASYARDARAEPAVAMRRADKGAGLLFVLTTLAGVCAVALLPVLGGLVTGGRFDMSALAVTGWAAYAAATAIVTPYGSLAAVRGGQVMVFVIRSAESALGIAVAVVLLTTTGGADWVPLGLAGGALVSGVLLRRAARTAGRVKPASSAGETVRIATNAGNSSG